MILKKHKDLDISYKDDDDNHRHYSCEMIKIGKKHIPRVLALAYINNTTLGPSGMMSDVIETKSWQILLNHSVYLRFSDYTVAQAYFNILNEDDFSKIDIKERHPEFFV